MVAPRGALGRVARQGRRAAQILARRIQGRSPTAPPPKPWESSPLDDLTERAPWRLVLKLARRWALRRLPLDRSPEVTVLVVNWETGTQTATALAAVRHFSPPTTKIFVIDNASRDGSAARFRRLDPAIRVLRLPVNVGHGIALDLGTYLADTELVVTLDSDAFPLGGDWLDRVTAPLRDPSVVIAGSTSRKRGFVHPMYCGVRRRAFVERNLSWQPWRAREHDLDTLVWGIDVGELLTRRLAPREVVALALTPNWVAGLRGVTAADVVYHHRGLTRRRQRSPTADSSWDRAVAALLPAEALPGS